MVCFVGALLGLVVLCFSLTAKKFGSIAMVRLLITFGRLELFFSARFVGRKCCYVVENAQVGKHACMGLADLNQALRIFGEVPARALCVPLALNLVGCLGGLPLRWFAFWWQHEQLIVGRWQEQRPK